MTVDEVFQQLHARQVEASDKRDMAALAEVSRGYDELLNDAPNDVGVLFSCATAHMQLGRNGLAIALFEKAISINDLPEIWNNLGTAYKAENQNENARRCWLEALKRREDADYYNNMSTLYVNEGNPSGGLEYTSKGLKLDPTHPRLRWNRSLLLLECGKWREGFEEYDWGFKSGDRQVRFYSNDPKEIPEWTGKKGQRVVVYGEQGVGDEIMFASAIPDLMQDCEVVFDCHPRLEGLFKRSFGIPCYGTRKDGVLTWPQDERLDARLSIGSLFRFYRSNGDFPRTTYLKPDPFLAEHYRNKLEALGPGPYVGIGWRAGTKSTRDDLRSIKLAAFNDLIDSGGTFVSLQYTADSAGKVERYKEQTGRTVHHWAEVLETGPAKDDRYPGYDYDHTIALIAALDLCILPNTTAVHVCGAIGKDCWTITPDAPAWRYQLSGDTMPMYGDWVKQFRGAGAIERITQAYRDGLPSWSWSESVRAASR